MVVKTQRLQTLAGHFGTHRVMVVEAHLAARLEPAGLRLADIVHHGGQAQRQVGGGHRAVRAGFQGDSTFEHNHRVLEDVLVAVVFVDLQLQGWNFREEDVRKTGFDQRLKAGARTVGEQQFGQFVAHTLGGYDVDAVAHRGNRLGRVRRDTEAQLGHESHGAHHTQRIVVKGLSRIHRRAQHALGQITGTTERVHELQVGHAQSHRVDGEVAAGQVALKRVAIIDLGLTRVRIVRVRAIGGDLHLDLGAVRAAAHGTQRAELAPHVPEAVMPPPAQYRLELLRPCG